MFLSNDLKGIRKREILCSAINPIRLVQPHKNVNNIKQQYKYFIRNFGCTSHLNF